MNTNQSQINFFSTRSTPLRDGRLQLFALHISNDGKSRVWRNSQFAGEIGRGDAMAFAHR
jgi:hypothetical protein